MFLHFLFVPVATQLAQDDQQTEDDNDLGNPQFHDPAQAFFCSLVLILYISFAHGQKWWL